jgi:hypothetical protein
MKYMEAELMFKTERAWYENGLICLLLSDKKEVRFPVGLKNKLNQATDKQRGNTEIICNGTGLY